MMNLALSALLGLVAFPASSSALNTGDPTGDVVIVANQGDQSVHVIDAETGQALAKLTGFDGPHEVAVSPDGRWAVVSDYGTQTVQGKHLRVIDLESFTLARSIDLGEYRRPHDLVFLPGGENLVVTSETHQAVLMVDFATGEVRRRLDTQAAGSHMLTVTPDGRRLFTANMGAGSVTEIDIPSGTTLRTVPVPAHGEGIAVSPDGQQLWVSSLAEQNVTVYDTRTWEILDTLGAPGHPYRVTISPDGTRAFVPSPAADVVRVFDLATRKETLIPVSGAPGKVTIGPDGKTLYLPLNGADQVGVLDLASLKILRRLESGPTPDGLAVSDYYRRRL